VNGRRGFQLMLTHVDGTFEALCIFQRNRADGSTAGILLASSIAAHSVDLCHVIDANTSNPRHWQLGENPRIPHIAWVKVSSLVPLVLTMQLKVAQQRVFHPFHPIGAGSSAGLFRIAQQSHVINRECDMHLGTLRHCRETGAIDHSAAPRFARTMLLYISLLNNESQSLFIPQKGGPVFHLRHGSRTRAWRATSGLRHFNACRRSQKRFRECRFWRR
jgi:hypothetical protein